MSTETVAIATQEDTGSQLWKKKYTLLLKKTENIDKQNLRLINRTYQITRITKRLRKEQRFLKNCLAKHLDNFKEEKFYHDTEFTKIPTHQTTIPKHQTEVIVKPPKKPLNAFIRYCNTQRHVVLNEQPSLTHLELTKQISNNWNNLNKDDKKKYYLMFEKDKQRYADEMKVYLQKTDNISKS